MDQRLKRSGIAAAVVFALALPAGVAQAQDRASGFNPEQVYQTGWSADEMIGTDVRGANGEEIGEVKDIHVDRNGNISRVVVEVGGFLEIGDQHIGVPWKDVRIGPEMQYVEVPLREVENGTYSLYGRVPEGEDVATRGREWRVNELIGDYASLRDIPRYGMVSDVIFDEQGKAQAVIVNRGVGPWGRGGWFGYPYAYPDRDTYELSYRGADVGELGRFDYVQLGELSRFAGEPKQRGQQRQQARQPQKEQAAAGGATTSAKPSRQAVLQMVEKWKETPQHAAKQMIDKYGAPDEATPSRLIWFNNGPWKRTTVYNVEIDHEFPMPHKDALEQVVNFELPPDKVDELARFDGSVYVDRTRGEISARCDAEPANILALNLAQDIVSGKRSVEEAREFYPKALMAHLQKEDSPYTEKLAFTPPDKAGFTDEPVVSKDMIEKAKELKQAMMQKDEQQGGVADQPGGGAAAAGGTKTQQQPPNQREK